MHQVQIFNKKTVIYSQTSDHWRKRDLGAYKWPSESFCSHFLWRGRERVGGGEGDRAHSITNTCSTRLALRHPFSLVSSLPFSTSTSTGQVAVTVKEAAGHCGSFVWSCSKTTWLLVSQSYVHKQQAYGTPVFLHETVLSGRTMHWCQTGQF